VWSLVTLLTVLPLVVMVVPDLVFRTQVSSRFRYMFPAYLGVQLAVAHLLVGRMGSTGPRAVAWRGLAVLLLTLGATTCLAAVRAETWWGLSRGDVVAGRILREAQHPLIVSRAPYGVVTTLAHMVEPDTPFVLFGLKTPITLPPWAGEVFAYRPSPELARALAPYGVLRPACAESDRDCLLQRLQWR
jgi:hypothetical protein